MQASACFAVESPATATFSTLPSDRNVSVARAIGSSGPRHARAAGSAVPTAPCTAPRTGFRGALPVDSSSELKLLGADAAEADEGTPTARRMSTCKFESSSGGFVDELPRTGQSLAARAIFGVWATTTGCTFGVGEGTEGRAARADAAGPSSLDLGKRLVVSLPGWAEDPGPARGADGEGPRSVDNDGAAPARELDSFAAVRLLPK